MKVKLISGEKNKNLIYDILSANNIIIDDVSKILISDNDLDDDNNYDIKIVFKEDKLAEFSSFIKQISSDIKVNDIILGKKNDTYFPLNISSISYFNAVNNDTFANIENGESYQVKKKLYQLEEELGSVGFFRINKSELVNMKKISFITPMFKGKLIINLDGYNTPFDISRNYTQAFKERLGF